MPGPTTPLFPVGTNSCRRRIIDDAGDGSSSGDLHRPNVIERGPNQVDCHSSAVPVVIPATESPAVSALIVVYGGGARHRCRHRSSTTPGSLSRSSSSTTVATTQCPPFGSDLRDEFDREHKNLGFGGGNNRAASEARAPMPACSTAPARRGWLDPWSRCWMMSAGAVASVDRRRRTTARAGAMVDHWGYTGRLEPGIWTASSCPTGRTAVVTPRRRAC